MPAKYEDTLTSLLKLGSSQSQAEMITGLEDAMNYAVINYLLNSYPAMGEFAKKIPMGVPTPERVKKFPSSNVRSGRVNMGLRQFLQDELPAGPYGITNMEPGYESILMNLATPDKPGVGAHEVGHLFFRQPGMYELLYKMYNEAPLSKRQQLALQISGYPYNMEGLEEFILRHLFNKGFQWPLESEGGPPVTLTEEQKKFIPKIEQFLKTGK